jgi:hypothetical protein
VNTWGEEDLPTASIDFLVFVEERAFNGTDAEQIDLEFEIAQKQDTFLNNTEMWRNRTDDAVGPSRS